MHVHRNNDMGYSYHSTMPIAVSIPVLESKLYICWYLYFCICIYIYIYIFIYSYTRSIYQYLYPHLHLYLLLYVHKNEDTHSYCRVPKPQAVNPKPSRTSRWLLLGITFGHLCHPAGLSVRVVL